MSDRPLLKNPKQGLGPVLLKSVTYSDFKHSSGARDSALSMKNTRDFIKDAKLSLTQTYRYQRGRARKVLHINKLLMSRNKHPQQFMTEKD